MDDKIFGKEKLGVFQGFEMILITIPTRKDSGKAKLPLAERPPPALWVVIIVYLQDSFFHISARSNIPFLRFDTSSSSFRIVTPAESPFQKVAAEPPPSSWTARLKFPAEPFVRVIDLSISTVV